MTAEAWMDAYLCAERLRFTGIGLYPHWRTPGFHLDLRDEADSAGAPYSLTTQTRRGVICTEIESLTTTMMWGKAAGVATGYNERRYAGTHVTFLEGGDIYAVIFGLGDTTAGSVDITGIGVQFINLETL
jgi:hypothetical protein